MICSPSRRTELSSFADKVVFFLWFFSQVEKNSYHRALLRLAPWVFLTIIFASLFLTRPISAFVPSLKFDRSGSCSRLNLSYRYTFFSSTRFCLAFLLEKIIAVALVSILINSQSSHLSVMS